LVTVQSNPVRRLGFSIYFSRRTGLLLHVASAPRHERHKAKSIRDLRMRIPSLVPGHHSSQPASAGALYQSFQPTQVPVSIPVPRCEQSLPLPSAAMPRALLLQRSTNSEAPVSSPATAQPMPLDILASVALSDAHEVPPRPQTPESQIRQPFLPWSPSQHASPAAPAPSLWMKGVMMSQEDGQEPVMAFCPRTGPADPPPSPSPRGPTASGNLSWRTTPYSGPPRPWEIPARGRYRQWWDMDDDYPTNTTPCPPGRGVVFGCLKPHPDSLTAVANHAEDKHDPVACQRWHAAHLTILEHNVKQELKLLKRQMAQEGAAQEPRSQTKNGKGSLAKKRKLGRKNMDVDAPAPYSSFKEGDQAHRRIKQAMSITNIVNSRSPEPKNGSWLSRPRSQWAVVRRKWNPRVER
jgi:hypothetical protein